MICDSSVEEEVTVPGTIIISPNHPSNYGNNQNCQKKIRFGEGQSVLIKFIQFDIEYQTSCIWDWVEIRDVPSNSSNQVGSKLCGETIPNPIPSTGNTLTVIFHSDEAGVRSGFKMKAELGKIHYIR